VRRLAATMPTGRASMKNSYSCNPDDHVGRYSAAARRGSDASSRRGECRDSNFEMCFAATSNVALALFNYAEPQLTNGMLKVSQTVACTGREKRHHNKHQSRPGGRHSRTWEDSENTSTATDTMISENHTFETNQEPSLISRTTSSESNGSEKSIRGRRTSRGRSPTFRSNSVNAKREAKQKEKQARCRSEDATRDPARADTTKGSSSTDREQSGCQTMNLDHWEPKCMKAGGTFEKYGSTAILSSMAAAKDDARKSPSEQQRRYSADGITVNASSTINAEMCIAQSTPPFGKPSNREPLSRGAFRQASFGEEKGVEVGEEKDKSVYPYIPARSPVSQLAADASHTTVPAMSNRSSQKLGMLGPAPPTSFEKVLKEVLPSPPPPPPVNPINVTIEFPKAKPSANDDDKPMSNQPKLQVAHHLHSDNDVTIIVGSGSERRRFHYNSHVLLYISDYFSQVMVPDMSSPFRQQAETTSSPFTTSGAGTGNVWLVDFSHKQVKDWEMFYPFLEPPVKRTVSVNIFNLPHLLPWFHEFQLHLLLHQCDQMLSEITFRPVDQAETSDVQDVLLLLYAALSCDLPNTKELGIAVLESYLKEAPHLFLYSALQRLIILLTCFPHFQQQLWESTVQSSLPAELKACYDTACPAGRDALLHNPMFPFLLREVLSNVHVQARTRIFLRSKIQARWSTKAKKSCDNSSTGSGLDAQSRASYTSRGRIQEQAEEYNGDGLEMSSYLGEQFWGPGWNEEPRLSKEQIARQEDRRQFLEDIVQKLKEHVQHENAKVEVSSHISSEAGQRNEREWNDTVHGGLHQGYKNEDDTDGFLEQKDGVHGGRYRSCKTQIERKLPSHQQDDAAHGELHRPASSTEHENKTLAKNKTSHGGVSAEEQEEERLETSSLFEFETPMFPVDSPDRLRHLSRKERGPISSASRPSKSKPGSHSPDLTASTMSPTSQQSATNLYNGNGGLVLGDGSDSSFTRKTFQC